MISSNDFKERWENYPLSKLSEHSFAISCFSESDREFLIQSGLPEETYFDAELSFNLSDKNIIFLDKDLNDISSYSELKQYIQIGQQLSSPILMNLENNSIYILRRRNKTLEFVCSSINQLAELIIVFDEVYEKFRNGEINRKNKKQVLSQTDYLISESKRIDSEVLKSETVWTEMIDEIKRI